MGRRGNAAVTRELASVPHIQRRIMRSRGERFCHPSCPRQDLTGIDAAGEPYAALCFLALFMWSNRGGQACGRRHAVLTPGAC